MPEQSRRPSPLAGLLTPGEHGLIGADGPGLGIGERRGLSIVEVAALKDRAEAAIGAIEGAQGVRPSPEPNIAVAAKRASALWIAPDEWLVIAGGMEEGQLYRAVREAAGGHAAIVDHSHGRCVIRMSGRSARDVLAKGCPLDLHPGTFPPGRCAQSLIGDLAALIHLVDETPTFDLYVLRSFARSFWEWVAESAAEFGYRAL